MNVFEFVLGLVLIGTVASLVRMSMGVGKGDKGNEYPIRGGGRENAALRDEVKQLKDRLAVIERITVEKENGLEREIERLRDQ
jgi:1,6-anhydro-N-acetylmuramate kinase